MASHLTYDIPIGWGGPWGSEIPPLPQWRVIWYQSAQTPLPAPSLSGGGSTGPSEVVGFSPLLVEDSLLLWQGVEVFLPGPKVDDFPLWPGVDDFPPWLKVDLFPPRSGVGWAPSCHLSEAPAAGVSVWVDLGR